MAVPRTRFAVLPTQALERDYRRMMFSRLAELDDLIRASVEVMTERLGPEIDDRARADSLASNISDFTTVLGVVRIRFSRTRTAEEVLALARRLGLNVATFNKRRIERWFKSVVGVDPLIGDGDLQRALLAFERENLRLITNMESRLLDQVETEITAALRAGKRADDLAPIIRERLGVARSRAKLIARDQLATLNGQLNEQRQTELGIRRYEWQTSEDERVREEHEARNGVIFEWANPPPDGHPGEPINCFPASTRVAVLGRAEVLMRHWYTGELTELVTDTGETLRATSNHPVLTRHGWTPIESIDVGEDLFGASEQADSLFEVDVEHRYASLGDCFHAAAFAFQAHASAGLPGQFHGDSTYSEVEVIALQRELPDEWDAASCKLFCELILPWADMDLGWAKLDSPGSLLPFLQWLLPAPDGIVRGLGKTLAVFGGESGHADSIRCRARAGFYSCLAQASDNGSSLATELFAECQDANFVSDVAARYGLNRKLLAIARRATYAPIRSDAFCAKALAETIGMDFELNGGGLECQSRIYKRGRVVEKRSREFESHVYNLQSSSGCYLAGEIVVSNCRCVALPIIEDVLPEAFFQPGLPGV